MDIQKSKSLRSKIRDKEGKIEGINLDTQGQIKKILNKVQLQYFNNNQYDWWEMDENCWHSNKKVMHACSRRIMLVMVKL
jgi:hypothetical protein